MLLSCPDSLSGLFFALLGVYLFFTSFATKLHFFLGVFLHFITGDDTMNSDYYDLRGKIVKAERRISVLTERQEMWAQYQKYKPVRQKLDKVAPAKREQFEQRHSADLALSDAAVRYLDTLKTSGESITPKAWRAEAAKLTAEKDADYLKMRAMREDIKAVETLKKTAERLAKEGQPQRRKEQER